MNKVEDFVGKAVWIIHPRASICGLLSTTPSQSEQLNVGGHAFWKTQVKEVRAIEASEQINLVRAVIVLSE